MKIFPGFIPMTCKELSCLHRCAEGRLDAEIGAEFELTSQEVSFLLEIAMRKLKSPNRMAALARAAALGLFEPGIMAQKDGLVRVHPETAGAHEREPDALLTGAPSPYRDVHLLRR